MDRRSVIFPIVVGMAAMGFAPRAWSADTPADGAEQVRAELQAAHVEADRANAKLALAEARQALLEGRRQAAQAHARQAIGLLARLPSSDAVTDQVLLAEGILARAQSSQSTTAVAGQTATGAADAASPPGQMSPVGAAQPVAASPQWCAAPSASSTAAAGSIRSSDDSLPDPASQFARQARLKEQVASDAVRELIAVDEARQAPDGWISYPPDWPAKSRKRDAKYPGGLVARTDGWTDAAGREWYMGIYDVSDLTYVPPDFVPATQLNPVVAQRVALDRDAYRFNSFGFGGGWMNDPYATLALLRHFGGVEDVLYRGPKYSLELQQQLEQMVKLATGDAGGQPMVISLPPVQAPQ